MKFKDMKCIMQKKQTLVVLTLIGKMMVKSEVDASV